MSSPASVESSSCVCICVCTLACALVCGIHCEIICKRMCICACAYECMCGCHCVCVCVRVCVCVLLTTLGRDGRTEWAWVGGMRKSIRAPLGSMVSRTTISKQEKGYGTIPKQV
jgi:hypothetical protein